MDILSLPQLQKINGPQGAVSQCQKKPVRKSDSAYDSTEEVDEPPALTVKDETNVRRGQRPSTATSGYCSRSRRAHSFSDNIEVLSEGQSNQVQLTSAQTTGKASALSQDVTETIEQPTEKLRDETVRVNKMAADGPRRGSCFGVFHGSDFFYIDISKSTQHSDTISIDETDGASEHFDTQHQLVQLPMLWNIAEKDEGVGSSPSSSPVPSESSASLTLRSVPSGMQLSEKEIETSKQFCAVTSGSDSTDGHEAAGTCLDSTRRFFYGVFQTLTRPFRN